MSDYGELTTLDETRRMYLGSAKTADDELVLSFIQEVSGEIHRISGRQFRPYYRTHYYNTPRTTRLYLNTELVELISITNGNGDNIPIANVKQEPLNEPNKVSLLLQPDKGIWYPASNGYPDGAITVVGIWAYLVDDTAGWSLRQLLVEDLSDSITTINVTSGVFVKGLIIRIDNEFMYVQDVTNVAAVPEDPGPPIVPAVPAHDHLTVVRGINGTTAAAHITGASIYDWSAGRVIRMLAAASATAYYNLRSNPTASSTTLDGVTFETPKDITEFIKQRLNNLTLLKMGFA